MNDIFSFEPDETTEEVDQEDLQTAEWEAETGGELLRAPFPWFGGKSRVAPIVWGRFGDVENYCEPFFGSGAVLLGRPETHGRRYETVNDKDGFISNFWRSLQHDPEAVARYADWPVNENDLTARHIWLNPQRDELTKKLEGDPDFYDAKIAGWWAWGICCWIGSGWCQGRGPWQSVDGKLTNIKAGAGAKRQRPMMFDNGVHRQMVSMGGGTGVNRKMVSMGGGTGVNRKRVHLTGSQGVIRESEGDDPPLYDWFNALAARLRHVRVCCGDWSRIMGPSPTWKLGITGVFLDPPYAMAERSEVYSVEMDVADEVRKWAIENGDNDLLRIALCGYAGEHEMPENWEAFEWEAVGGYGNQGEGRGRENKRRERIWFSPACLKDPTISSRQKYRQDGANRKERQRGREPLT